MTQASSRVIGLVLALVIGAASAAVAQDDPHFALVASFPSPTVSFQWEVSERFALRIEGSYTYRDDSTESASAALPELLPTNLTTIVLETATRIESTAHNGSIGLAGIFTIHRSDQVRLYVAPRVSVAWSSQRVTSNTTLTRTPAGLPPNVFSSLFPRTQTFESSSTSPGAGASFGAATNVHRRLALFGEAGFVWSRSDLPLGTIVTGSQSPLGGIESTRTTVNTRAVGGVMFLF